MPNVINATTPTIRQQVPEATFDKWVLVSVSMSQSGMNSDPCGEAWYQAARVLPDGSIELLDKKVNIVVQNLLTHSQFTNAGFTAVTSGLENAAKEAGVI